MLSGSEAELDWQLTQPSDSDPIPEAIEHITFVLFLPDGECVLPLDDAGLLSLPSGEVLPGEHWLLDSCLRIPLMTAGIRIQRAHPFATSGRRLFVWAEGDVYSGNRLHATVPLTTGDPDLIANKLRQQSSQTQADLVSAAARSHGEQDEAGYFADSLRMLEPAYLRATTSEGGSGFGSGPEEWRLAREPLVDGITIDGTFLDVGCANGLLMESVHDWCGERGLRVEPYGIDLAPGLVHLARRRLPRWADRIWVGNALDWIPPDGQRFDFIHTLLDCVPPAAWRRLIEHHRRRLARPGGRLLVSHYVSAGSRAISAAGILGNLGYAVAGESTAPRSRPGTPPQTAWLDVVQQ